MKDINTYISQNRSFLMGFSMIFIMLFHQPWIYGGGKCLPISVFHSFGHYGVDIFLVVSGFGIAHSLSNRSIKQFYKNRIIRLLPTCVIVGVISTIVHCSIVPISEWPLIDYFYYPLSLNQWYIVAIIIYYLFSPLFFECVNRYGICFVLIIMVFGLVFCYVDVPIPYNWAMVRMSSFVLGIWLYLNKLSKVGVCYLYVGTVNIIILAYLIYNDTKIFDSNYFHYIVFVPALLFVCICINSVKSVFDKLHITSIIEWMGKHSLELYLWHAMLFLLCIDSPTSSKFVNMFLSVTGSFVAAYLTKCITGKAYLKLSKN